MAGSDFYNGLSNLAGSGLQSLGGFLGNAYGGRQDSFYQQYWQEHLMGQQTGHITITTASTGPVAPVIAKPEDEIGWLRRRVSEVLWT